MFVYWWLKYRPYKVVKKMLSWGRTTLKKSIFSLHKVYDVQYYFWVLYITIMFYSWTYITEIWTTKIWMDWTQITMISKQEGRREGLPFTSKKPAKGSETPFDPCKDRDNSQSHWNTFLPLFPSILVLFDGKRRKSGKNR